MKNKTKTSATQYPAWICCDGAATIRCMLKDVSSATAKVVLEAPTVLPDEFDLFLTQDRKVGRKCMVAWRGPQEYLIAFGGRVTASTHDGQFGPQVVKV
jgi:hypothetical protein